MISVAVEAVGSFADQIAKIMGCRTVRIAGGDEKCRGLTGALGYDAAVDYKAGPIADRLKAACPNGIDVSFDNVGGETFEAVLSQMKMNGPPVAVSSRPMTPRRVSASPRTARRSVSVRGKTAEDAGA